MVDPKEWRKRQIGSHDDIFAVGVISLNFGQLENMLGVLFISVTGMTELQVEVLFRRIQNDARVKIFDQLLTARTDLPPELVDRLKHFSKGYENCVDNRNSVLHSHSSGTIYHGDMDGMLLGKFNKSGGRLLCPVNAEILQRIADEILAYSLFAAALTADVEIIGARARRGDQSPYRPGPLSDKPPLPRGLDWQPEATFLASLPQRQS